MSTFWKPTTQITPWKPNTQPELYHYGVKGMKWHQHKAGLSPAANGGGLANPIDSLQEAWWQFEDDSGITDYYKQKESKKEYERNTGRSWADRLKSNYEKARKKFYKTPMGKAAKYVDAGKEAVKAFKAYVRNN